MWGPKGKRGHFNTSNLTCTGMVKWVPRGTSPHEESFSSRYLTVFLPLPGTLRELNFSTLSVLPYDCPPKLETVVSFRGNLPTGQYGVLSTDSIVTIDSTQPLRMSDMSRGPRGLFPLPFVYCGCVACLDSLPFGTYCTGPFQMRSSQVTSFEGQVESESDDPGVVVRGWLELIEREVRVGIVNTPGPVLIFPSEWEVLNSDF